jgi:hypothetical protein
MESGPDFLEVFLETHIYLIPREEEEANYVTLKVAI